MTTPSPAPEGPADFLTESTASIQGIRGALTDALAAVGADARRPRDITEGLGIHKLLAWRLSKIVTSTDTATPLRQLPGASGLKILAKALEKAGAPADRIEAIQESVAAYRRMIERHAGDESMHEAMLASGQQDPGFADMALGLRKQAYFGAASVWGAHARIQVGMSLVAPARGNDELVDLAYVGGLVDFRRLRESVFWPVHRGILSTDVGASKEPAGGVGIRSSLVPHLGSDPAPEFDVVVDEGETLIAVKPGPVGQTGAMTWLVDRIKPAAVSRYREDEDELAQYAVGLYTPVELVQFDLLVHRELPFALPPEAKLCGDIARSYTRFGLLPDDRLTLPLAETVRETGSGPPSLSNPHFTRTVGMAEHLCEQVGRKLDEFTGYRIEVPFPPIPTFLFLRHPLLARA